MGDRERIDDYQGLTTTGIDVSYHRGRIQWGKVVAKHPEIRFVVVRTGDAARVNSNSTAFPTRGQSRTCAALPERGSQCSGPTTTTGEPIRRRRKQT
ncbi:MAG: hypothetical protein AB7K71_13015 [Polyangiaceae bacterium]